MYPTVKYGNANKSTYFPNRCFVQRVYTFHTSVILYSELKGSLISEPFKIESPNFENGILVI